MKTNKNIAHVIKLGDRFFCKFGAKKRVLTAHCLSGAETYQQHDLAYVVDKLVVLGKSPEVVRIGEI